MNNINGNTVHRSTRAGRQSIFYRDLSASTTPMRSVPHKNVFATPGQAAAATALWRENFGGSDPPPPPIFTLEDRVEFSPEANVGDYCIGGTPENKTPVRSSVSSMSTGANATASNSNRPNLGNAHQEAMATPMASSYSLNQGFPGAQQNQNAGSSNWWSPVKDSTADGGDRGRASALSEVVQQQQSGGLLTLPRPREIVRPDIQRSNFCDNIADEEEWVTVFGFSPADTNLVLREFEKCGIILKHVPGPGDANWMHILYQNHYDAQKALQKNGMQINGVLIVGVKPVDPTQRQALSDKTNCGFMILPPHSSGRVSATTTSTKASSRPYYLQSNEGNQRSSGAIASPSKSTISKIVDLMFGI